MAVDRKRLKRISVTTLMLVGFVTLFCVILLWRHIVITVPAGHVGVMWWRFFDGTDITTPAKGEGIHIIFPWDKIFVYNARMQEIQPTYRVVANNGLNFDISVSIRWSIRRPTVGLLHKEIGPNYLDSLLIPNVGSVVRETISQYEAEDIYAQKRNEVQKSIYTNLIDSRRANNIGGRSSELDSDFVYVEDLLITSVGLPETLRMAIERKFTEAEYVKEYTYRIEREVLESKRKAIEAEGIKKFQETVTPTISDAYLRWTGIQATLKLADSQNSKFVMIGNGPGGLPVILNGFDGEKPKAPDPAAEARPAQ